MTKAKRTHLKTRSQGAARISGTRQSAESNYSLSATLSHYEVQELSISQLGNLLRKRAGSSSTRGRSVVRDSQQQQHALQDKLIYW